MRAFFIWVVTNLITSATMNTQQISLRYLMAGVFSLSFAAFAQEGIAQKNLPRLELSAGMHLIQAQVAALPEERQTGLMHRLDMPTSEGMLFVFEQVGQQCFWMKNTLLPLTAAFIADDGTIVNFADMKPQTLEPHCSAKPVRYVLEMNQGWFAKKGIKVGSQLKGSIFEKRRP